MGQLFTATPAPEPVPVSIDWQAITRAYCDKHALAHMDKKTFKAHIGGYLLFGFHGLKNKGPIGYMPSEQALGEMIAAKVANFTGRRDMVGLCCQVCTKGDYSYEYLAHDEHDVEFFIALRPTDRCSKYDDEM